MSNGPAPQSAESSPGDAESRALDELRAALGLAQLPKLLSWNEQRRSLSQDYRALVASTLPEISIPFSDNHATAAHLMPILLPPGVSRKKVINHLRENNIQSSMHYPPIHRFSYHSQ